MKILRANPTNWHIHLNPSVDGVLRVNRVFSRYRYDYVIPNIVFEATLQFVDYCSKGFWYLDPESNIQFHISAPKMGQILKAIERGEVKVSHRGLYGIFTITKSGLVYSLGLASLHEKKEKAKKRQKKKNLAA